MINSVALSQNPQNSLKLWHTLTSAEYYGVYSNPPKTVLSLSFSQSGPWPSQLDRDTAVYSLVTCQSCGSTGGNWGMPTVIKKRKPCMETAKPGWVRPQDKQRPRGSGRGLIFVGNTGLWCVHIPVSQCNEDYVITSMSQRSDRKWVSSRLSNMHMSSAFSLCVCMRVCVCVPTGTSVRARRKEGGASQGCSRLTRHTWVLGWQGGGKKGENPQRRRNRKSQGYWWQGLVRAGKEKPDVTLSQVVIKEVGLLKPEDHQVCRKPESR